MGDLHLQIEMETIKVSHDKKIEGPFEVKIKTQEREWSKTFTDTTSKAIATSTATDIGLPEQRDNLADIIQAIDNMLEKQPKEESKHLSFGLEIGHSQLGYIKISFKKESSPKK